jgi:hypothetical protein
MTTTLIKNKRAFGVETEATENTAETIVAADCFRAINPEITVNDNMQDNEGARTTRGKNASIPGGKTCDVSFGAFEKGSGTAGTAPASPIVDAHLAAGFTSTNYTARHQFDLGDTDASCTVQLFEGRVVGATAKSKIARGVKLNCMTELNPGQAVIDQFEGNGVFENRTDATVLAASGEDTTKPPPMINECLILAEAESISTYVNDGTQEVMLDLAASNLRYSVSWTPSANRTVIGYAVKMEKVGTPANETLGFQIQVETDAAGDPSDTPVANTTVTRLTTAIEAADEWEFFMLAAGSRGAVTGSTPYHVVLEGDWDVDASNTIKLDVQAVAAGAQNCKYYDAAWAALALKNLTVVVLTMPSGGDRLYQGPSTINLNNEISVTPDDPCDAQGHHAADLTDADPTWTLSPRDAIDSEVDLAEYLDDQDELFLMATVGSTAGNIIEHVMMRATVNEQSDDERDNKMVKGLVCRLDREKTEAIYTKRYK